MIYMKTVHLVKCNLTLWLTVVKLSERVQYPYMWRRVGNPSVTLRRLKVKMETIVSGNAVFNINWSYFFTFKGRKLQVFVEENNTTASNEEWKMSFPKRMGKEFMLFCFKLFCDMF